MSKKSLDDPKPFRGGVHSLHHRWSRKKLPELERLLELALSLRKEVENNAMIIVEGQNDAKALEKLGVTIEPFLYSQNSDHIGLFQLARSYSKVIILVDNDKEGWRICKKLVSAFAEKGIRYDLWYRKQFYKIGQGKTLHLEEFSSIIDKHI
jgi:5S rRNA maturation endonuclease (ribonuclease M5)